MTKKQSRRKSKKKGSKNAFAESVLGVFASNPFRTFNYKQISGQLGINDKASRDLVNITLLDLVESGAVTETSPGKYQLSEEYVAREEVRKYVTGTVDMKQTGKAYLIRDDGGEDVFIASNNTYHALNNDKVKVFLFPERKGRKTEGQIVEILQRSKSQYVGIVEVSKNFAFLVADNKSMPVDIFIPKSDLQGARTGQKAVARITEWPEQSKNPFGKIIHVLGEPGDNNVEMQAILADNDFPLDFPAQVKKEAGKIPAGVDEKEIRRRRDYRKVFTITIDPEDAKDYDDAISLQKLKNGHYEVGVHIADVSHYVKEDSPIDKEAFRRGTSIYLVDRVIPMLPEQLSNNICSLRPDEDKLCFSAIFEMDMEGKVHQQWFGKTVIRSDRRFNYEEVQEVIEKGQGEHSGEILVFHHLAQKLREERFRKGSINFETQEVRFRLDEKGKPLGVYLKEQKESNKLIEDFMLLANRKVAESVAKPGGRQKPKTFVYRIHDTPNEEKLESFSNFLAKLGYKFSTNGRKSLANSFNRLFREIDGKGEQNMIETIAIRTMAKAVYSTVNIGHYGLGFSYYTHFTSPIRRYPDLMVHRLLERYLDQKPSANQEEYEDKCDHSSVMERRAVEAERESVKYKQAEYLMDKIGQTFDGLISGVSKWGIFVELVETRAEGMVRLSDLDDDFYYLDEENYQVIGHRHGYQYKLGDSVKVRIKKIDIAKKEMDMEMVHSDVPRASGNKRRKSR